MWTFGSVAGGFNAYYTTIFSLFDTYYGLLHDKSMIVANYLCLASGTCRFTTDH